MNPAVLPLLRSGLFDGLPDSTLTTVADRTTEVIVAPGRSVVEEGSPGDAFYVVADGTLVVHTTGPDHHPVELDHIGPGDHFGEQALLQPGRVRTATVTAHTVAHLLRLDADVLHHLMAHDPTLRSRLEALGRQHLDNRLARRSTLIRALVARTAPHTEQAFQAGQIIAHAGTPATHSYIVIRGRVQLHNAAHTRVGRLGPGLGFGNTTPHPHTITAEVDTLVWAVPHGTLTDLQHHVPGVGHQLAAVSQAWALPRSGLVTQVVGEVDGIPCIDQHYALHDGRTVVVTLVPGDDTLRATTLDHPIVHRVSAPDGRLTLLLDATHRVRGLLAHRTSPAIDTAMDRILEGQRLGRAARATFLTHGLLDPTPAHLACTCMRVPRDTARAILQDADLHTLTQRTGAGSVCGTCLRDLRALADTTPHPTPRVAPHIWDGGPAPVLLFVAGRGIHLAIAMMRTLVDRGWPHHMVVDWSVRSPAATHILGDLHPAPVPNLSLRVRVTHREPRLDRAEVVRHVQRFPSAVAFVSGPTAYRTAVTGWLAHAGLPAERVNEEHLESLKGRTDPTHPGR